MWRYMNDSFWGSEKVSPMTFDKVTGKLWRYMNDSKKRV